MKYIYDIVLNFNYDYYEFYEWKNSDKIVNIKKIPVYKVNNDIYLSIKYNDVVLDTKIKRMCLITNSLEVMGIVINNYGKVIKRSSLLLDEEDSVLDESDDLKETPIKFKKNIYRSRELIVRDKKEKRKYIKSFLKNINKKDDEYLLKYIYYDLFKCEDNVDNIYNNLLNNCDINLLYEELKKLGIS